MGKVINFPKEKSNRVLSLAKLEAKKFALSLGVLSILVVAVSIGEKINDTQRPQYVLAGSADRIDKLNRAIASAQPLDIVEDIHWEHQLVGKLNEIDERKPASLGQRPSVIDQLRFGKLAGKYRISEKSALISEIEYVDSNDVSDRPISIGDRLVFLNETKDILAVRFSMASVISKTAEGETYRLFDAGGKPVGSAAFQFDEKGNLLSLKVQE